MPPMGTERAEIEEVLPRQELPQVTQTCDELVEVNSFVSLSVCWLQDTGIPKLRSLQTAWKVTGDRH